MAKHRAKKNCKGRKANGQIKKGWKLKKGSCPVKA